MLHAVFLNLCLSRKADFFFLSAVEDVASRSDVIGGFVLYVLAK